jgi:outer membrane protein OmpA-like peptidoglycan-associated protein
MPETGGPVPAFLSAVQARDLSAAGLLAHDVRLAIPPLHYVRQGAQDVAAGIADLLATFGELRYELHSRYLGPACVADEAVLVGRQAGPFLGAPPSRHPVTVPARLIIDHDGVSITRITLWPDLAALRASVAGVDQVIDLRTVTQASGMIAALRATIPPRQTRIIAATARVPPSEPEPPPLTASAPAGAGGRAVPRTPVPKSVRQRRAVLGGGAMLVAAVALTSWVAVGALSLPGTPVTLDADRRPATTGQPGTPVAADAGLGTGRDEVGGSAAGPDGTAWDSAGVQGSKAPLAPAAQLAAGNDTVVIRSDLLFATDSAKLTPGARRILNDLIAQARRQDRRGRVIVNGYTDDVGSPAYNLQLSKRRAAAVATALGQGLRSTRMRVESHGYGESRPAQPGTSTVARQANRRVTVEFPPQA